VTRSGLQGGWLTREQARPLLCGVSARSVAWHMTVGSDTPKGRIKLECRILGKTYYTRKEWIDHYLEAVTEAVLNDKPAPRPEPAEKRQARFTADRERLAQMLG
jgi:hypothetical protein